MRFEATGDVSPDMRTAIPPSPPDSWGTVERDAQSLCGGEELQGRGVDHLRPFDESEVAGMRYLQVTAVGDRIGDLLAQVWGQHDVVLEADDEHRGRNAAVRG